MSRAATPATLLAGARLQQAREVLALLAGFVDRTEGRHGMALFERLEREIAKLEGSGDALARARRLAACAA